MLSCARQANYREFRGYAQGGTYTVKANLQGVKVAPSEVATAIDSILQYVDTTLSGYNAASQLSRFNRGETFVPDSLFISIYDYARDVFVRTDGAVDVASAPLFDIWGFGFTADSLPSSEMVSRVLEQSGMGRLSDSIETVLDPDGTLCPASLVTDGTSALPRLNYNAIAQGLTCDLVATYLHSIGVKDMLVDIGEIYCEGLNPSGTPWRLGIDRPFDGNETPGAELEGIWTSDGGSYGVVTSGNYRKYYVRDGKKYAHTIDPRCGYPVTHSLLSATVIAPNAADADAYATYCMVIGLDEAKIFIESHTELEAYLVYSENEEMKEWYSSDFFVTVH